MKLKVLELFGGIGACSKALERLGIEHEIVDAVEIDKYAVKSFNAIHNTNFEPQDICEWDKDIEVDLIMHGSPCQDFSLAGKQAGGDEGSGNRSSLMYETIRIVGKLKPKYVIWENVKNLLSKKHIHNFNAYLETMEKLGYTNYYQVLNAKDYGIPQNRERVFTISVLGDEKYEFPNKQDETNLQDFLEKDTNIKTKPMCEKAFDIEYEQIITSDKDIYQCNVLNGYQDCKVGIKVSPTIRAGNNCTHILQRFEFPPKQELKLKLKDMLEDEVDEKYYLSDIAIDKITRHKNKIIENENPDESSTLHAGYYKMDGRDQQYIKIKEATRLGYKEACEGDGVNISSRMKYQRGNVQKESIQTLTTSGGNDRGVVLKSKCKRLESLVEKTDFEEGKVLNMDLYNQTTNENISQCLTEPHHNSQRLFDGLRIRKITPKEAWRLMGFDDEDFEKASKVNSNTQLYKQAGNSIVVNVLEAILTNLLK